MIKENHVITNGECTVHPLSRVCWSAIFAGAFVGIGLGFLLNLFGIAIGLSAFSATPSGTQVIALGGLLGLLIGTVVSMGAAGYVAGFLGKAYQCHCHSGIIYGFVTWSLALMLSAALVMPLTKYVNVYKSSLTHSVVVADTANDNNASTQNDKTVVSKPIPTNPTDLAWYSWVVFILFIVGAFASCLGACCAMMCKKDEMHRRMPPSDVL